MDAPSNLSLAPSIRILIEETASVLERIGTNPPHRNGVSALYGRHLRSECFFEGFRSESLTSTETFRSINRARTDYLFSIAVLRSANPQPRSHSANYAEIRNQPTFTNEVYGQPEMQFSAMSDDQIIQAIHEAGDELGNYDVEPGFQIDERSGLDWLDWFNMDLNT